MSLGMIAGAIQAYGEERSGRDTVFNSILEAGLIVGITYMLAILFLGGLEMLFLSQTGFSLIGYMPEPMGMFLSTAVEGSFLNLFWFSFAGIAAGLVSSIGSYVFFIFAFEISDMLDLDL